MVCDRVYMCGEFCWIWEGDAWRVQVDGEDPFPPAADGFWYGDGGVYDSTMNAEEEDESENFHLRNFFFGNKMGEDNQFFHSLATSSVVSSVVSILE